MIRNNRHKYSLSAMCAVLQLPRSTYYYEANICENNEEELTNMVVDVFKNSRNIYGQRKIKKELEKLGWQVSRRRIGRIMNDQGLVSKYTVAQFNLSR
ncbi:putative transposase [Bacillus capparidis]|uniref:Transposase n=1 Tax=Bacillus capparidis TaxID=1840411 RepID=A0ABS4CVC7_9BACI|nr:putative transposase [Bacillus capparidis]